MRWPRSGASLWSRAAGGPAHRRCRPKSFPTSRGSGTGSARWTGTPSSSSGSTSSWTGCGSGSERPCPPAARPQGDAAMRRLLDRRPGLFCLAVTAALFVLTALSRISFPQTPVRNIERLPQKAFEPPTGLDRIVSDLKSPDVLFWGLAILLAVVLLVWTGLWREAGFNRPTKKNLRLLWFPLFVGELTLSGGAFVSGFGALVSAFLALLVADR